MDNSKNRVLDAWRPDHQDTDIGEVRPGMGGAYYQTYPDTHWIEDASYVRVKVQHWDILFLWKVSADWEFISLLKILPYY